jgi:hypothetical protein
LTEHIEYQRKQDGLLFVLDDDVRVLVSPESEKRQRISMCVGDEVDTFFVDLGNINARTFRKSLVEQARERFGEKLPLDDLKSKRLEVDLSKIAGILNQTSEDAEEEGTLLDVLLAAEPSVGEVLLRYAGAAELFHTEDLDPYASFEVDGHYETWPVRSRGFKNWLRYRYYVGEREKLGEDKEPRPISSQVLTDVLGMIESKAQFQAPEIPVHLRIAGCDGRIYIDLCDPAWRVVEVGADGWRVIPGRECPIRFIRASGMMPLPDPVKGGSADALRNLLNLAGEEGEGSWRLILAWMVAAFMPAGPYPVLTLLGPQGAAKSTAARIVRQIVDPSSVPLRSTPRDEHNLYIDARSSWVVALDNMSTLPLWLSDALCRLATGGGFSTRQLYTDVDQVLFEAQRPCILNGIGDVITRPDLLDRALIVNLPAIPKDKRRLEREIYADLEAARPKIFGFLLDAIVKGLKRVDKVRLKESPRMADFARWGVATEEALGGEEGSFMEAYEGSQEEAVQTALEAWPATSALYNFAVLHKGEKNAWKGTATELLAQLNDRADDEVRRSKEWPKAPNALTAQLNRLSPDLREVGVYVVRPTSSHSGGRKLKVFFIEPPPKRPSPSSQPAREDEKPHTYADSGWDGPFSEQDDWDGPFPERDGPFEGDRPPENPVDKLKNGRGDDGDGWDGLLQTPHDEESFDEDEVSRYDGA